MLDMLGLDSPPWCSAPSRGGWHRHHLIPRQVWRYSDLRVFLSGLHVFGLDLEDFESNGLFLPSRQDLASLHALPLHSGSHRVYNDVVVSLIARARDLDRRGKGPFAQSLVAVRTLQALTRETLL